MFGYTKVREFVPEVNQTHRGYIFGYTKEVSAFPGEPNA